MFQGYRPAESVGSDGKVTKYGNYTWFSYEDCAAMRDAVGAAIEHENLAPAGPDGVSVALHLSPLILTFVSSVSRLCLRSGLLACSPRTATNG